MKLLAQSVGFVAQSLTLETCVDWPSAVGATFCAQSAGVVPDDFSASFCGLICGANGKMIALVRRLCS